jgi:hypothetical protein
MVLALWALGTSTAAATPPPNPFAIDQWDGLANLDSAHGAKWLQTFGTSITSPSTLYAGFLGDGVFRSTDDGISWAPVNDGLTSTLAKTVRAFLTPQTGPVLAGTAHGLYRLDGTTWSAVAQGPEADPAHPKNLNQSIESLLAPTGGNMLAGTAGAGVWTSSDSGATWSAPAQGNGMPAGISVWGMVSVAGPSPASPIVLAATDVGVYRSNDFGATWAPKSDGIPFVTVLMVYADATNPNVLYAGTLGEGVYRSLNFGESWAPANGSGSHALNGEHKVQSMMQFSSGSAQKTRLYVGTRQGVWAGETGNGPHPGAIAWRELTETGLHTTSPASDNVIFWGLTSFLNDFPGTLLGGTQSNGGYALHMTPPQGPAAGVTSSGTISDLHANDTLTATVAGWTGTPTVEFTWQWQRCDSAGANCADVDGATGSVYKIVADDVGHRLQVKVTGRNDYPSFTSNASTRTTTLADVVGAALHPELAPGANSITTPNAPTSSNSGAPLVQVGDTLTANGWGFNPAATSRTYRWYRCDNPTSAHPDPGTDGCTIAATTGTTAYVTTADDLGEYVCVVVIGTNQYGTAETPCGARTSDVVAPNPALAPGSTPLVVGHPYVGDTVVGSIGEYTFGPVRVSQRYWYRCDAQGNDCASLGSDTIGQPAYTVTADDLGSTLEFRPDIDTNGGSQPPAPASFSSPPSAVVTEAPPAPASAFPLDEPAPPPAPGGSDPGTAAAALSPPPLPGPVPAATPPAAKLLSLSLKHKRVKRGASATLRYKVSNTAKLLVEIETLSTGHRSGQKCRSGRPRKGQHRCTLTHKLGSLRLKVSKTSGSVSFKAAAGGRSLKPGTYTLVVTPLSAGGRRGHSKSVTLKIAG